MSTQYTPLTIESLPTTTLQKRYEKLGEMLRAVPWTLDKQLVVPGVGEEFYVTIGELLNSRTNEEFTQYDINPSKVLSILDDKELGMIRAGTPLYQPIKVGYMTFNDAGQPLDPSDFIVVGGRHRLTALLTGLCLSGHNIAEETVRAMRVRVQPVVYSLNQLVTDNGSRAMTPSEKVALSTQKIGVDWAVSAQIDALVDGRITKAIAFRNIFQLLNGESSAPLELQPNTLASIGSKLLSDLTPRYKYPKTVEQWAVFFNHVWSAMPEMLQLIEQRNITNIARDGVTWLASDLGAWVRRYPPEYADDLSDIKEAQQSVIKARLTQKTQEELADEVANAKARVAAVAEKCTVARQSRTRKTTTKTTKK